MNKEKTDIEKALHEHFSKLGKKGGSLGGKTTNEKYGYEHYRKLGEHMNAVKKAKREALQKSTKK